MFAMIIVCVGARLHYKVKNFHRMTPTPFLKNYPQSVAQINAKEAYPL
jgi:hypothetical protein